MCIVFLFGGESSGVSLGEMADNVCVSCVLTDVGAMFYQLLEEACWRLCISGFAYFSGSVRFCFMYFEVFLFGE